MRHPFSRPEPICYLGMVRRVGPWQFIQYERERKRRERVNGRKFDPVIDGEPMLRAIGATEEQISRCKELGLA